MKKRIPWGRGIAVVLAVVALAVALPSAAQWWKMRTECADAEATDLAVLPNAIGTTGVVEVAFSPKYDFVCKEMLVVEHDLPDRSRDGVTATVTGLRAQLTVTDNTGKVLIEEKVTDDWFWPCRSGSDTNSFLPVFFFHPVRPGDYRLRLTVTQAAVPLVDVSHRVVARYQLCGIERLGVAFMGGTALLSTLICLALATGVVVTTRKKRRHSNIMLEGIP
jgi:hypothetical protein